MHGYLKNEYVRKFVVISFDCVLKAILSMSVYIRAFNQSTGSTIRFDLFSIFSLSLFFFFT